jgi:hypothetical protein
MVFLIKADLVGRPLQPMAVDIGLCRRDLP